MQLLVWLTETETGDLDEIRQKQRYMAYFDEIKHDGKLKADSLLPNMISGNSPTKKPKKLG